MKQTLYWIYALTLLAMLTACGSAAQTPAPTPASVSEPAAAPAQVTASDQAAASHAGSSGSSAASSEYVEMSLPPVLADTSLSAKGDANRGKAIFASSCAGCHSTATNMLLGPGLAGLFSANGPTLPNGIDYKGMLPNGKERSEANVAEWIRNGGSGSIGFMPSMPISDEQMADLLAYLRTLE